jgi:hypothetical protein
MKELIESLEITDKVDYLLDTCFVYYMFNNDHIKKLIRFCQNNNVGMTSFNLEELDFNHHKLNGNTVHHLRDFLKKKNISRVDIPVFPGNPQAEKNYISKFDSEILNVVKDPSDAVMFVAALKIGASIITRDKHHVFTAAAENYSSKYKIEVLNNLPR